MVQYQLEAVEEVLVVTETLFQLKLLVVVEVQKLLQLFLVLQLIQLL